MSSPTPIFDLKYESGQLGPILDRLISTLKVLALRKSVYTELCFSITTFSICFLSVASGTAPLTNLPYVLSARLIAWA